MPTGTRAPRKAVSKEVLIITSRTKNTVMATPTPPTSHQNKPPSRPQVRPLESDAALVSVKRSSVFMLVGGRGLVIGSGITGQKVPTPTALLVLMPKMV